jgi:hypothetical protein
MVLNTNDMAGLAGVGGETQLPDWSTIKDISPTNQGETLLPDNLEGTTSIEEKIGSFSEGEAMLFAAELGLKDTYRGITQLVGYNESETKHDQQVLYNLMENPEWGNKVKAMYIGGMILDPAGWLIPVAKARTVARAAWQGFKWGGVSGYFGYVDGDSTDRLLQAAGGAAGGTILSGGLKGIQRAFTRGKPQPATVAPTADARAEQILGLAEGAYPGQAVKLSKVDDTSIKITGKEGETIFDWSAGKSAAELIDNPEATIKYFKGTNRVPLHHTIQQFLSHPYQTSRRGYDKFFEDKLYKPVFQNPIPSIVGASGFVAGQEAADAFLRDQFEKMEEQNHLQNGVFSQAMISSIGLASALVSGIGMKKYMKTAGGEKIADHFGRYFMDNYNVPTAYVKMKQNIGIHENSLETKWEEIVSEATALTQDEKYVLYYFFDGKLRMDQAAPALSKEAQELGPKAQKIIMETGQKMVDVGLLDPKVFNKNKDKYIHRTYLKHLTDVDKSLADSIKKVKNDIGFIGDELKPRGYRKEVGHDEVDSYKEAYGDLIEVLGQSSSNKDKTELRILLSYEQRQGLGEIEDAAWALLQTAKVNLNDLSVQTFFRDVNHKYGYIKQKELDGFLKKSTNKKLTQADREYFSKQYKEYKGRIYEKLSPEEQAKMVLVPDSSKAGTKIKLYGNLAGRYLPKEILSDLRGMRTLSDSENWLGRLYNSPTFQEYRKLNAAWKSSVTSWNPAVHTNNTTANFFVADANDVTINDLRKYGLKIWTKKGQEALSNDPVHGDIYGDMVKYNVFDSSFAKVELGLKAEDASKIYAKEFLNLDLSNPIKTLDVSMKINNSIWKKLGGTALKPIKSMNKIATAAYGNEDRMFRAALYVNRLDKGMPLVNKFKKGTKDYDDALTSLKMRSSKEARDAFVNYDIQAPAVQLMRDTLVPFIAYPYRMIPQLVKIATTKPHKFVKWAALGYAINYAGVEKSAGHEQRERALLDERQSSTWFGLPFMPPSLLKLPDSWNLAYTLGLDHDPVTGRSIESKRSLGIFVERNIPGGDMLGMVPEGQSGLVPFLPIWAQPSFGVLGAILIPLIAGANPFTGDQEGRESVFTGGWESWAENAMYTAKELIPENPFFGTGIIKKVFGVDGANDAFNSYSADKLLRALREKPNASPYREDLPFLMALSQVLGIKMWPFERPVRIRRLNLNFEIEARKLEKTLTELQDKRSKLPYNSPDYKLLSKEIQEEIGRETDKMQKLIEEKQRKIHPNVR